MHHVYRGINKTPKEVYHAVSKYLETRKGTFTGTVDFDPGSGAGDTLIHSI